MKGKTILRNFNCFDHRISVNRKKFSKIDHCQSGANNVHNIRIISSLFALHITWHPSISFAFVEWKLFEQYIVQIIKHPVVWQRVMRLFNKRFNFVQYKLHLQARNGISYFLPYQQKMQTFRIPYSIRPYLRIQWHEPKIIKNLCEIQNVSFVRV